MGIPGVLTDELVTVDAVITAAAVAGSFVEMTSVAEALSTQ